MPKGKRRSRAFYLDSNIAIDYITSRNRDTISVLDKIKERGWPCISCSFLAMELADYKKESLFIADKAMEEKWEMRRIIRERDKTDLKRGDFEKVSEWFNRFKQSYKNITLYDFLTTSNEWQKAQEISFNSNLNAPDAIHLTSALIGASGGYCQILVTSDKHFIEEAKRIIDNIRMKTKLKVMTIPEVRKRFFNKHK